LEEIMTSLGKTCAAEEAMTFLAKLCAAGIACAAFGFSIDGACAATKITHSGRGAQTFGPSIPGKKKSPNLNSQIGVAIGHVKLRDETGQGPPRWTIKKKKK
jgi:hypothetical protein